MQHGPPFHYALCLVGSRASKPFACRQEFESAWQRVVADTDWQHAAQLSQLSSDHQVNTMLCQTQLCHAAQVCYADPAHSLMQAFPLETLTDMLLELTGSQDSVVRRLVEAALLHGEPDFSLMGCH